MTTRLTVATATCLLCLAGTAQAAPKRALFAIKVSGAQSTTVNAGGRCRDAGGATSAHSGRLTERVDFNTTRAGTVLFKAGSGKRVFVTEQNLMLVAGTVNRQSSLDERGVTPGDCAEVVPASGCGSRPYENWRLSLWDDGTGSLQLGLRTGTVTGGDPFRVCQNPFDGFPHLVRRRPAVVTAKQQKKVLFNRKKRVMRISGTLNETRSFADGYTPSTGTVNSVLQFTATLTRR
ncbi:MAG: hypothetical protein QOF37_472 [Thermoleophilaceae bacterium]|nr:hypothetical protein [Thermoleophilaceae bacterium]